jgi:hypothetical protein
VKFFKPEDFQGFFFTDSFLAEHCNRLLAERGTVVYGYQQDLWTSDPESEDQYKALLINVEPIEPDTAEKVQRKC